jgi:glucose uptake protein GlcU
MALRSLTLNIGGKYRLTNEKLGAFPIKREWIYIGIGIVIVILAVFIIARRRYWFW